MDAYANQPVELQGLLQQMDLPEVEAHLAGLLDADEGAEKIEENEAHLPNVHTRKKQINE